MPKYPFSLACTDCDAGMGFQTKREAAAAGWIDVHRAVDGTGYSDLGMCPHCQVESAKTDAETLVRGVWCWNDPAERPCQDAHPNWCADGRDPQKVFERVCEAGKALKAAELNLKKTTAVLAGLGAT